jgi:hypothetical protein
LSDRSDSADRRSREGAPRRGRVIHEKGSLLGVQFELGVWFSDLITVEPEPRAALPGPTSDVLGRWEEEGGSPQRA